MIRVVQIERPLADDVVGTRVAVVEEPILRLVDGAESVHELAREASETGQPLADLIRGRLSTESIGYDDVYAGRAESRLLPPIAAPHRFMNCLVTGTGLTHRASAESRANMHGGADADQLWGQDGADLFVVTPADGPAVAQRDSIRDFDVADRIDLRPIDADLARPGDQAFAPAILAAASTAPGALWFAGGVLHGNTDTDSDPEFGVQVVFAGIPGLTAADLLP